MSDVIIVAVISFFATGVGTFGGIMTSSKLTLYRIEQLEKKVERHNNLIERMYRVEDSTKSAHKRIDEVLDRV